MTSPDALRPDQVDLRIQRHQRHRPVAGILRDAAAVDAQHGVVAVDAVQRRAARARDALVAGGPTRVAEVRAPRPLQDVAAQRRHVAELRAGGKLQALRDGRVAGQHARVRSHRGHAGKGAHTQATRPGLDAGMHRAQRGEVHQALRGQHVELHQIEQRRAAGQELHRRIHLALARLLPQPRGLRRVHGAVIGERAHQARPICARACLMAVTMLG